MLAEAIDYEEEKAKMIAAVPPLALTEDMNCPKLAKEDMWNTTRQLQAVSKRKVAVSWSLPTELFAMTLSPQYLSKPTPDKVGLGYNNTIPEVPTSLRRCRRFFLHTRRSQSTPIDAHHSLTWQLDKKNRPKMDACVT